MNVVVSLVDLRRPVVAMRFTLEVVWRILPILIVDLSERVGVPLGLQRDLTGVGYLSRCHQRRAFGD